MLIEREIDQPTPLTKGAIYEHQYAVRRIDELLEAWSGDSDGLRELQNDRAHLASELAAGRYLPLPKEDEE